MIRHSTKNLVNIQSKLTQLLAHVPQVHNIVSAIDAAGGQAYLVGGAVRDLVIEILAHKANRLYLPVNKQDIDIEVHRLNLEQLGDLLAQFGTVSYVGKSFGVLKLHGLDVDWSLPRLDSEGRKPQVQIEPFIDITTALRRRDLCMNAMALNIKTGELIDPFGGISDIEHKRLRSPDTEFFTQDPLRFFRVMQFISRFEYTPDQELDAVCARMHINDISRERIEAEFEKLLLLSKRPSLGLRWLHKIERIREILPELGNTIDVAQEPEWHPEGDVFEHSMQAVDAAAQLSCDAQTDSTICAYNSEQEKLICMYAALCHDLGKAKTSKLIDGRIRSRGHDAAGVPLAKKMLSRITHKKELIEAVAVLVAEHMQPLAFEYNQAKPAAYKRLALRLKAGHATIDMLAKVALADRRGRNGCGHEPLHKADPDVKEFIKRAQEAQVLHRHEEQMLHGRDITDLVTPGPKMGEYLRYAYDMQIDQGITDKNQLRDAIKQKFLQKK